MNTLLFLAQSQSDFAGKVAANPMAATFSCLLLIPGAILTIRIVHLMIGGEIDFWIGLIVMMLLLLMIFVCNRPPADWVSPIIFLVVLAAGVGWPIYDRIVGMKMMTDIDIERLERAYKNLDMNPTDGLRQFHLARILVEMNLAGHAVGIARGAINNIPKIAKTNEDYELKQWESLILNRPQELLNCPSCKTQGVFEKAYCARCGSPYILYHFKLPAEKSSPVQLVLLWVLLIFGLILVPVLAGMGPIATLIGIPIIIASLIFAITKLVKSKGAPA